MCGRVDPALGISSHAFYVVFFFLNLTAAKLRWDGSCDLRTELLLCDAIETPMGSRDASVKKGIEANGGNSESRSELQSLQCTAT